MKKPHKHLHLARRKMGHIIDEIYTTLLHYGSEDVDLHIRREENGLCLRVESNFSLEHTQHIERMGELLDPVVRSAAMVEEYWELAGEDQYTSDSEMALVGQMADEVSLTITGDRVNIELRVLF